MLSDIQVEIFLAQVKTFLSDSTEANLFVIAFNCPAPQLPVSECPHCPCRFGLDRFCCYIPTTYSAHGYWAGLLREKTLGEIFLMFSLILARFETAGVKP